MIQIVREIVGGKSCQARELAAYKSIIIVSYLVVWMLYLLKVLKF